MAKHADKFDKTIKEMLAAGYKVKPPTVKKTFVIAEPTLSRFIEVQKKRPGGISEAVTEALDLWLQKYDKG